MVTLEARVSAREWPPGADLTTPLHVAATFKCDNLKASYGREPSGSARPAAVRDNVREVTLTHADCTEAIPRSCTLSHEDHR